MDLGISGKVVVYTGAAGLIGRNAVMHLAQLGAKLALVDINITAMADLVECILREVPEADVFTSTNVDTLSAESIDLFLAQVKSTLGDIDCLINSAYPRTDDWHLKFEDIPAPSLRKNIDDHMAGYLLFSQRAARHMMVRKSGNIIFFGSIYGLVGPDFSVYAGLENMTMPAAYSAIKGGISNFTRYLASYLGPYGIRVNAICPGGVENLQAKSFLDNYCQKVPLRRMAAVDDVVGPLVFLISNLSCYITGINLAVDGGWSAI